MKRLKMIESPMIVLASASRSRQRLLRSAGVGFEIEVSRIDENEIKRSLQADRLSASDAAAALAELKALHVAQRFVRANDNPGSKRLSAGPALIIGADQVLACEDRWFDKPTNLDEARTQLRDLRGREHQCVSAICAVRDNLRIWHHVESARLRMRDVSDAFLEAYLDAIGDEALETVGAYRLEGLGAQLFAEIHGDYFTILGLPLLPLLEFLREQGAIGQ